MNVITFKDSGLLVHDVVLLGEWFLTFQWNVVLSSAGSSHLSWTVVQYTSFL